MEKTIKQFLTQIRHLESNRDTAENLPENTYYLNDNTILCYPRAYGVSRFPYYSDGLVIWASQNGYLTANESDFTIFRPSYTDEEPCIAFFMGLKQSNGEYFPISMSVANQQLFEPVEVKRYTVYTMEAAYYIADMEDMTFAVRVFVSEDKKINFTATVINKTDDKKEVYIASFFEALLRFEESENFWSKGDRVGYHYDNGNYVLRTDHMLTNSMAVNRVVTAKNVTESHFTTARRDYLGINGRTLSNAFSLRKGHFEISPSVTMLTDLPAACDNIHFNINGNESVRIDYSMTITHDFDEAVKIANEATFDVTLKDAEVESLKIKENNNLSPLSINFEDWKIGKNSSTVLNKFIRNVQKQVSFCAFGKCYAGPLLGVRDVFQQLEGALIWQPGVARDKIVTALNYIDPTGRAPRQFAVPPTEDMIPQMDLRAFIDQGIWIISTVYTYLAYTGDYSILDELCGYYTIVDEKINLVSKCEHKDTVLEHLLKIMDYLTSNLDREYKTNCLRILFGDWNDALDGLGHTDESGKRFGPGVSVMATLQFYQNLYEMSEILRHIGGYEGRIKEYMVTRAEIEEGFFKYAIEENEDGCKRIIHGWGDKLSYKVGSFHDTDGASRISFAPNAFYALSGMIKKDLSLKDTAISAIRQLDSVFGIKTNTPCFPKDMEGIGRIADTVPGIAENCCAYVHASMFSIMGLFAMGQSELAWEEFEKSMAISHDKLSHSAFVMPNSYCENYELNINGESLNDWFTGSGAVLIKGLVRFGFGLEPSLDGITIQTPKFMPANKASLRGTVKGCVVTLNYENKNSGERKYFINGKLTESVYDQITDNKKVYINFDELKDKITVNVVD